MSRKPTAFVTGSTGFLGIHLVQELAKEGFEIIALHRKNSKLTELKNIPGVRFVVGDITDRESLHKAMPNGVDVVFHAAGSVEILRHNREKTRYLVNQGGTKNMVEVCLEKKVGRFIHTSTVLTYDFQQGRVSEESRPNPNHRDHYIYSKRLAELEVEKGVQAGLDAVILCPSAIFGAYDKATWSKLFQQIHRGLPVPFFAPGALSAAHMRKVAQAHVKAYQCGRMGQYYILGGPDVTILELAQNISCLLKRPGPKWVLPAWLFRMYGRFDYWLSLCLKREPILTPHTSDVLCFKCLSDSSKAIRELNYQPSSVEEMLRDCHRWMIQTGLLPADK